MNDLHAPRGERHRFQFSLRTLLLLVAVGGVGSSLLGRMALDLVSKDERRAWVLGAPFLILLAFFLVAASYSGATKRDRAMMQLLHGLLGVIVGAMIAIMLCLDWRWSGGHPLIWTLVAAIIGGLIVILLIHFLWWCRDRVAPRWWIVGSFSLLLLITLPLGLRWQYHPQRQTIAEIRKLGAYVRRNELTGNAVGVSFRFYREHPTTDADLDRLNELTSLKSVSIGGRATQVTDTGLAHLRGLANLRSLGLEGTQVTDAGLKHVKELANLRFLTLTRTQVTDAGLVHLRSLRDLRHLRLDNTDVTDAGLKHIQVLRNLQSVELRHTKVTAEGVKKLQEALSKCKIRH